MLETGEGVEPGFVPTGFALGDAVSNAVNTAASAAGAFASGVAAGFTAVNPALSAGLGAAGRAIASTFGDCAGAKSVFPCCDGQVVRLSTRGFCQDNSSLFTFWFGSGLFGGTKLRLPVTGFALEVGGNYQFLHTLNDLVYFYSFGDRVGELNITGMAFIRRSCNTGFGTSTTLPSYFNPFNWNINPFSDEFANDPNWVSTNSAALKFNQRGDSICDLWDFYTVNMASKQNNEALKITWGNCEGFYGFLTGMRVEIPRPDIPVAQYVMRIHVIKK